jgi:hypothetical protein
MPNSTRFRRMKIGFTCGALFVISVAANSHASSAPSAAEELPLIGSPITGTVFYRTCPDNHVLTGFRYRGGLALDGISIKCRPVRSDGTLGTEVLAGSQAGGNGGTLANKSCAANEVMTGQRGILPSSLSFFCVRWSATSRAWFGSGAVLGLQGAPLSTAQHTCSSSTKPATGIRGRHGMIIDAIGLVCNTP